MRKLSTEKRIVLNYLEKMPPFRERRMKSRGLANLAKLNHPSLKDVPREVMIEIVEEVLAQDRAWRWWLEDKNRPDLRGKDYFRNKKTKTQMVQETQVELGYESGANLTLKI